VPRGKKLPQEVINHWPEVFKDVTVESVPIEYLQCIRITFSDGKIWEISPSQNPQGIDIDQALEELLNEYEDSIVNVDFSVDTLKVKEDIMNRTRLFMKKRK
jgi:hypothetical protein